MATKQASQSTALAFALVGALGFLGYTMLGEDSPRAPTQPQKPAVNAPVVVPVAKPVPAVAPLSASPASANSADLQIIEPPRAAESSSPATLAGLSTDSKTLGAAVMAPSQDVTPATQPPVVQAPSAPAVVPPPLPTPVAATEPPAQPANRAVRRAVKKVVKPIPEPAGEPVVAVPTPTAAQKEIDAPKPSAPIKPAAAPAKEAAAASRSVSLPFSKEEMTVTISGEQAWVQVSPTRTMTARKGDVLPNLGKILEIRKNEVVAEKGTLTTN